MPPRRKALAPKMPIMTLFGDTTTCAVYSINKNILPHSQPHPTTQNNHFLLLLLFGDLPTSLHNLHLMHTVNYVGLPPNYSLTWKSGFLFPSSHFLKLLYHNFYSIYIEYFLLKLCRYFLLFSALWLNSSSRVSSGSSWNYKILLFYFICFHFFKFIWWLPIPYTIL